jgi:hypothetical protein
MEWDGQEVRFFPIRETDERVESNRPHENVADAVREQLVRYKYLTPFCRFVIRLGDGSRIHVNEPGQLGRFDDEKVQYTDARGRWRWIAYRAHRPSSLKTSR